LPHPGLGFLVSCHFFSATEKFLLSSYDFTTWAKFKFDNAMKGPA